MFTANREDSGKSGLRKGDKPLDFDLDTGSHESVLGENFPQFVTLFGIAPVQGTDGAQRRKFRHGRLEKKDENQTEGIVNEHGALAELKSSHKEAAKTKPSKSEDFEGFKSDAAF